jgi:hypothetical protein
MARLALLLLAAIAAFGADDPWTKVKELKSGTDIRVLKKGSVTPVLGKFGDATDDNLIIIVKNEEIAIAKDLIDRLDSRPAQPRFVKETKTKVDDANTASEPKAGMNGAGVGPGYSSGTSIGFQGKGDFETLYTRPKPTPKQSAPKQ